MSNAISLPSLSRHYGEMVPRRAQLTTALGAVVDNHW